MDGYGLGARIHQTVRRAGSRQTESLIQAKALQPLALGYNIEKIRVCLVFRGDMI